MGREEELASQVFALKQDVELWRQKENQRNAEVHRVTKELIHSQQLHRAEKNRSDQLAEQLSRAREKLVELRDTLTRLNLPPQTFGTFLSVVSKNVIDVWAQSRKLRVRVNPEIDVHTLRPGQELLLNDSLAVMEALPVSDVGEVLTLKDTLGGDDPPTRAVVTAPGDEEFVVRLADELRQGPLRPGDSLMVDRRMSMAFERIPKVDVEDLVLEAVPDIDYSDIGGLGAQLDLIRDAVELPFLHPDLFADYDLDPPKGILLYGPPGCGKTMIAKAVAHSLASKVAPGEKQAPGRSYFFNIKGPELLNKYVGETERQIRLIFQRARERAGDGLPVIVFFDEMESLFRTRGTGVSSDVETTIVPQLLSEIDGVERLSNVIIIGASNREDMIDPAILRPGRLDVKIKIDRPDATAARDIFGKYLTDALPLAEGESRMRLIEHVVETMYATDVDNEFLEVTYAGGDKETLYFKDFASGAMIRNVVGRAKKMAIKEHLESGRRGITTAMLDRACRDEFAENEDLPNTTNPDDWARVSGRKGERIVYVRTLVHGTDGRHSARAVEYPGATGHYL